MAEAHRKRLIVTADDFGLSREVNEAVEQAHRDGILTAASLMVSAPAAADAIARATRLPSLRVGLHLVMVEAWPTLPPEQLPDLVGADGLIRSDMGRLGLDLALKASARRQLAAEDRSPISGLSRHRPAPRPCECPQALPRASADRRPRPFGGGNGTACAQSGCPVRRGPSCARPNPGATPKAALDSAPWAALLAVRARQAGLLIPDRTLGLAWSGAMTPARVARPAGSPAGWSHGTLHPPCDGWRLCGRGAGLRLCGRA